MNDYAKDVIGLVYHGDLVCGTGFLVDPSGLIATCAHVLRDQSKGITFGFLNETTRYQVTVLAVDPLKDIALLKSQNHFTKNKTHLVRGLDCPPNTFFHLQGYGKASGLEVYEYFSATGSVIGITKRSVDHTSLFLLQLNPTAILKGMSGAPLISSEGHIFGVVSERFKETTELGGQALAIPIEEFLDLDKENLLEIRDWPTTITIAQDNSGPLTDFGSRRALDALELFFANGEAPEKRDFRNIVQELASANMRDERRLENKLDNVSVQTLGITFDLLRRQILRIKQDTRRDSEYDFQQDLISVPGDTFLMGTNDIDSDAFPQTPVEVKSFFISRYPVTNYQFWLFTRDTNWPAPVHWKGPKPPERIWNQPVVMVSWPATVYFCYWLWRKTNWNWRLPTEAEWEFAARGRNGRVYPWGNTFKSRNCNTSEGDYRGITDVDRFGAKGESPFGVRDMVGNVWEWTSSLWDDYPYQDSLRVDVPALPFLIFSQRWWNFDNRIPKNDQDHWVQSARFVMRGGSWGGDQRYATTFSRIWSSAGNYGFYGGFRLAVSSVVSPVFGEEHPGLEWSPYADQVHQENLQDGGELLDDNEMLYMGGGCGGAVAIGTRGEIDSRALSSWASLVR